MRYIAVLLIAFTISTVCKSQSSPNTPDPNAASAAKPVPANTPNANYVERSISNPIPVLISIAALIVSAFSLGWNFYRDVVLKARVRVTVLISNIHHGGEIHGPYISITVTNFGPGTVIIESIQMAKMSWLRFLCRPMLKLLGKENRYAHIMYDYTNPCSSELPAKINIGEKLTLLLPMNKDSSIAINPSHFGVLDSFGRSHWATRHSLNRTKKEYFEKYDRRPWRT